MIISTVQAHIIAYSMNEWNGRFVLIIWRFSLLTLGAMRGVVSRLADAASRECGIIVRHGGAPVPLLRTGCGDRGNAVGCGALLGQL
jgi:hypothetical protein